MLTPADDARIYAAREIDRLAGDMSHQDAAVLRRIALRLVLPAAETAAVPPCIYEIESRDP